MRQTSCLRRIGQAEFFGEFRLSVKRLCFCLVIYNECEYIRLISIELLYMHHNWYIVMHIIYTKVYSILKLISKRAPIVVFLDDQEFVWRHFRSNCYYGGLSGGTLSHPSLEDPYYSRPQSARRKLKHALWNGHNILTWKQWKRIDVNSTSIITALVTAKHRSKR